jgi:hypothetical protein
MDSIASTCSYSLGADLLAKFQLSSASIQGLSILALTVIILGIGVCIMVPLREAIRALALRRRPAVAIDRAEVDDGQWIACREGEFWLLRLPGPPPDRPRLPRQDG